MLNIPLKVKPNSDLVMALPFFPYFFDNRNKIFKRRTLLDSPTEYELRKHSGMTQQGVRDLFDLVEPYFRHSTNRWQGTPAETQFLTAMSFFRSGSFQYLERSVGGISKSTVSRTIDTFANMVTTKLLPQLINFPTTQAHLNLTKERFFDL